MEKEKEEEEQGATRDEGGKREVRKEISSNRDKGRCGKKRGLKEEGEREGKREEGGESLRKGRINESGRREG